MDVVFLTNNNEGDLPQSLEINQGLLAELHFPKSDVLNALSERQARSAAINLNQQSNKNFVNIVFEDIEGTKHVTAKIVGQTESEILLDQRFSIPIHRIISINNNPNIKK